MSQQGNYYGTEEIQQKLAEAKEAVKDNPKAMKAIAIIENIMGLADLTIEGVKLRSNKKKRIFPKRERKRYLKIQKEKNLFFNAVQQKMQLAQLKMIQAQPLRKKAEGWNELYSKAAEKKFRSLYLGQAGKEMVTISISEKPTLYAPATFPEVHADMNLKDDEVRFKGEGKEEIIISTNCMDKGKITDAKDCPPVNIEFQKENKTYGFDNNRI